MTTNNAFSSYSRAKYHLNFLNFREKSYNSKHNTFSHEMYKIPDSFTIFKNLPIKLMTLLN